MRSELSSLVPRQRSPISAGVNVVRSARPGSLSNFRRAACTAPPIGTLVNSVLEGHHDLVVLNLLTADDGCEVS